MPVPTTETQSEPSTVRLPQRIQTQLTDPTYSLDTTKTPPSVGPGAFDPSVIPPSHKDHTRTVVLCFDGTGDQFDTDVCVPSCSRCLPHRLSRRSQNSNIIQLFSMLKKDDKSQQVVYYQVCNSGIFRSWEASAQTQHSRPALGRTRFPRSRRRSGRTSRRRLIWLLVITSMRMSWVRCSVDICHASARLRLFLAGGYEFLMENCTSFNLSACSRTESPHFVCGARSCRG